MGATQYTQPSTGTPEGRRMSETTPGALQSIWPIMEEAFPPEERRTLTQQLEIIADQRYRMDFLYEDAALAGFIGYWLLDEFIFIEHLAVDAKMRGKGTGSKAVKNILSLGKPVVLEVEVPPSMKGVEIPPSMKGAEATPAMKGLEIPPRKSAEAPWPTETSTAETSVETRRIRMYERLGFVVQPYSYQHPAYDGSGKFIPMLIMVHGKNALSEQDFMRLKRIIYRDVYGVTP